MEKDTLEPTGKESIILPKLRKTAENMNLNLDQLIREGRELLANLIEKGANYKELQQAVRAYYSKLELHLGRYTK